MSNKSYGLGKERALKKKLLEEGANDVCRFRGSFGTFDLIAFYDRHIDLISVKSTKGTGNFRAEEKKIKAVKLPDYCHKKLYIWWTPIKERTKYGWELIEIGNKTEVE